jgi:hypothetical protein
MARAMYFDRGSKRRVQRIRWKPLEVVTAILFAMVVTALSIYVALWMLGHSFD